MDERYPNALAPGTRIGAVVLERAIGQGAWGIVYEGRHDVYGHVAVKEYFPSTYASRQTRGSVGSSAPQWQEAVRRGLERFGNEGRTLRTIRHENVVAVHDYIEQDDVALLVMEFVEGVTLTEALAADRFAQPADVMALGATLVDTLQALQAKNVLHRDIAPDNVMIRKDNSPVLIDFGGAGAAIASATRSSQNIVKDGYSPPEQYDTSATPTFPVGPWSDIYATAAVLYRAVTGREPAVANARLLAAGMKNAPDPQQPIAASAPPGYPAHWLAGVDAGLALLPKDRPQSASEWRKRFEAQRPDPKPNPLLIGVAAGSSLIAVALAAYAVVPKFAPRPNPSPIVSPVAPHTAQPRPKPSATPHVKVSPHHSGPQPAPSHEAQPASTDVAPRPPTSAPQAQTPKPTLPPKAKPLPVPSTQPTPKRTAAPTPHATAAPTAPPTPEPTPTPVPTAAPTPEPTAPPTPAPTPTVIVNLLTMCPSGYQNRYAGPTDTVCVTAEQRAKIIGQNRLAAAHRSPTGGVYGPNTCLSGYVWRNAYDGDLVCVTTEQRDEAVSENANAPARVKRPLHHHIP